MDKEEKHILRVQRNKGNGQKFVNIGKNIDISEGDYVMVKRVVDNNK